MIALAEEKRPEADSICVKVTGLSDKGRVRKNNEDNFAVCNVSTGEIDPPSTVRDHQLGPRGILFLVADGMGGEAFGELASQICCTTIPKRLYENLKSMETVRETNFVLLLQEAIEFANQIIYDKALSDPSYRGMGATTTAAALFGSHLFVAQVGDSRAYVIRNGEMVQVTRDQTYLNYLSDMGVELPVDLDSDSRKGILTQAVGTSESLEVKVTYLKTRAGDRILLCSDGLYNMVKHEEMLGLAARTDSPDIRSQALIAAANNGGGVDNITVVLADFSGSGLAPADPQVAVEYKPFQEADFQAAT